jgi:exonuclease III
MGLLADCASIRNHLSTANSRSPLIAKELFNGLSAASKEAPDIILGQEVFHTEASEKIGKDLAKMGYQIVVHDIGSKATSLNSGLFLASRCPLSNLKFMEHAYASSNTEKYASKGVLFAKASLGDKKLVIVNTHLNGGAKGGGRYPRLAQINSLHRALNHYIRENFSENEILDGVIVSGDMNISPFARDIREKRQYLKELGIDVKDEPLYDIIDPEWSFYTLLQGDEVKDEEIISYIKNSKCLPEDKINEILSLIKEIKALEPKDSRSKNRKDWESYVNRSKLLYDQILPVAILKSEDQRKLFGGPLTSFYYEHEILKVKDGLFGSSCKLEKDHMHLNHDAMIQTTSRLDYHLVRNKRGLEDMVNFKVPIHLETEVIKIEKILSDHYPVYSRFSV